MKKDKNEENLVKFKSLLDVDKIDDFLFKSKNLWQSREARGAYGGQLIGQALVAASQCCPPDFRLHSMHCNFLKPGNISRPIVYQVEVTRKGSTFFSAAVSAIQANVPVLTLQASFKREEQDVTTYQKPMPKVPQPDELRSPADVLEQIREQGRIEPELYKYRKAWLAAFPMHLRFVNEEEMVFDPTERQAVWMKLKTNLHDRDSNFHKYCLAYISDMHLMRTGIMHLASQHGGFMPFTTSLDHTMWFHAPFQVDEWMLFDAEIGRTSDGRVLVHCRVWDLKGNQIVTMAQEILARFPKDFKSKL